MSPLNLFDTESSPGQADIIIIKVILNNEWYIISIVMNIVIFVFGLNTQGISYSPIYFSLTTHTHTHTHTHNLPHSSLSPIAKVFFFFFLGDENQKIWELGSSE